MADDYAADLSTTGSLGSSDFVTGSIEVAGDHDWFRVELTAGRQYQIFLDGSQIVVGSVAGGTLPDPVLRLLDSAGTVLATNDAGSGVGRNALINFTAPATGLYFLDAGSAVSADTGSYTLSVRPFGSVQEIGTYMAQFVGQSGVFTVDISMLGPTEQSFALKALQLYQEVCPIRFELVAGSGQLTFDNSGTNISSGGPTRVHISANVVGSSSPTDFASHGFKVYLHEIGHALGLMHPGLYNGGNVRIGVNNVFANDGNQLTVMSYFGWRGYPLADRVVTPQMADIYAVQKLYGAVETTRLGDTVYGFHSSTGAFFDFATYGPDIGFTIYDSGGVDTLDASGYANNQILDLTPGSWSSVGGYVENIGIYLTTTLENAVGGSGSDVIVGNQAANNLRGMAGNDTLSGGGGANYLRGDDGNDSIAGGAEFDDINGNAGNDTASGGPGDDWVVGGKDQDLLNGDAGDDIVYGNLGDDWCDGGAGNDLVRGGQGNDNLLGQAGNDWLSGDRGDDTVSGGAGADIFHGSQDAGIDRITDFHLSEGDRVQLDPGTTYTVAQVGSDTVINMGGGNQMILVGVQMSTLIGGWIFGA